MSKKKSTAHDISTAKRKRIWKRFYSEKIPVSQLAEEENVTYWAAYRIINGTTKLDGSPRADKGSRRKTKTAAEEKARFSMDDFNDVDDFLLFSLMDALEVSATQNLDVADRVRIVKDINTIQTKIQQRQLANNIKRPDAEVIAIIIRKYEPKADYKRCVEIYTQAKEQFERSKS